MKQSKKCPKCDGTRIGYFDTELDDTGRTKGSARKLAESLEGSAWQLGPRSAIAAIVEAYVCTECGYFEEYVKGAKELEWDKLEAMQWHK